MNQTKQPRSIGLCIVLSIITCGIYGYYWMYCIHKDIQTVSPHPMTTDGGLVVLLSIVTCGIYGYYWSFKMGQQLDEAKGLPAGTGSSSIVYLVLSIFGFSIVAWALMQSELNRFVGVND